jgi:hypothetical protein
MYDLLLKGGSLVDPSRGLSGVHDIAIEQGKIARIAATIADGEARRVIQARHFHAQNFERRRHHPRLDSANQMLVSIHHAQGSIKIDTAFCDDDRNRRQPDRSGRYAERE